MAGNSPFGGGAATSAPAAPAAAAPAAAAPAAAPAAPTSASPGLGFGGGDPFSGPSGISGEKITQFEGELFLFKPTEVIPEMKTSRGIAKDVVRGDMAVLSGPRAGEKIKDMLVFQQALKRELIKILEQKANPYILARLGKSRDKGDGNDPAWIFVAYTDEDVVAARNWLKTNTL
ncbi:hypothetical protein SEA_LEPHLEUR_49 [Mycobacterium phage Lephleur]|uniref:Uncharacterized protein n=1 Tax=Mycobacterium phage Lephleur TaxID=2686234 RepID=A0A6B9L5T4_9CAUD|nr:hypothetical protein SEA_LEPHLEUR_49 [Mycobacterium phage Lephleur]